MHVVFKFCKNGDAAEIGIVLRDILTSFMFRWNYHMLLRCYLTFITIFDYSSELYSIGYTEDTESEREHEEEEGKI